MTRLRWLWFGTISVGAAWMSGCSPTSQYELARDACGLSPELDIPMPYSSRYTFFPITEGCVTHIAADIGMRWDSFASRPQGFRKPSDPAEQIIGGVLTLISADTGTVDDVLTDPAIPGWLYNDLNNLAWLRRMEGSDPAGALWYNYLTRRAWRVLYADELDAQMRLGRNNAIEVGPLDAAFSPGMLASFLMHEASHRTSAGHVSCAAGASRDCDPNANGAYGVGVFWMDRWLRTSAQMLPYEDCAEVEEMMYDICDNHILDIDGFSSCTERTPRCTAKR